ncbi:MAG: hypothetical protein ACTSR8_15815 [Promethearchaeota archaeon]
MSIYQEIKFTLKEAQFITIIGKYDHILGPRAVYSSYQISNQDFIKNLLRDALNTANKYVNIDYGEFYSQVNKVNIEDPNARGGKQLYAIILLRDYDYPKIPVTYLQRIEKIFHNLGDSNILANNADEFRKFSELLNEIYEKKEEILPIEGFQMKIRSEINTIQGFCELVLEMNEINENSLDIIKNYIKMMLDSCSEITDALKMQFGFAD